MIPMAELNIKSVIFAILLGIASWFWAFIIVGSAFFDYTTNQPITNPNMGLYFSLLILNAIITLIVLILYLWKFEKNNPIITNGWILDGLLLGIIICAMNFLLDALFFGIFQQRQLLSYFFLETTTGYLYPAIILETVFLAYLIYGRKE